MEVYRPEACSPIAPPCHASEFEHLTLEPIGLDTARTRFKTEAVRGTCATGRYRCRYYVWGSGPDLLLIPGVASDAETFILLAAHLSADYRCIAYDLPDGRTDGALLSRYTHGGLAADGLALLDHVGSKEAFVAGYSFGSTIALAALARQPDRLRRVVLVHGFARRPLAPAEVLLAKALRHWHAPMKRLPFRAELLGRGHFGPFADRPPELWQFFMDNCGAPPISAVAHRALWVHALDLRKLLLQVHQPTLVVSGDCDQIVPDSAVDELAHGLEHAVHVQLTRCGHFSPFTHAAELAEMIRRFLRPACPVSAS